MCVGFVEKKRIWDKVIGVFGVWFLVYWHKDIQEIHNWCLVYLDKEIQETSVKDITEQKPKQYEDTY